MFSLLSVRSAWRRPRAVLSLVGLLAVGLWLCGTGPAYASNIVKAMFYQLVGVGGSSQTARNRLNLVAGTNVTITPSDNSGTNSTDVTIAASSGATVFYQLLGIGGSSQTQRNRLNLVAGSNITLTPADNSGTDSSDVTIAASAGSSGSLGTPYASLDGSSFFGPVWQVTKPETAGTWSWQNQNSAVLTTSNGSFSFAYPATSGNSVRTYKMAAPATPYTVVAAVRSMGIFANNENCPYVTFRESATSKIKGVGTARGDLLRVASWANDTSAPSAPFGQTVYALGNATLFYRLVANGTTLTYSVSTDRISWYQLLSENKNAFFTTEPDQIGFSCDVDNGGNFPMFGFLFDWTIT